MTYYFINIDCYIVIINVSQTIEFILYIDKQLIQMASQFDDLPVNQNNAFKVSEFQSPD